jgi:hypothetical protein
MKKNWFYLLLLVVVTGCGSPIKNMVGYNNVNSVQLAAKCQTPEALEEVRKGESHQSTSNLGICYLLQVVYLNELNQSEQAKALYPKIIENASWIKSDAEVERDVKKMTRDLGKKRKRLGNNPDCS